MSEVCSEEVISYFMSATYVIRFPVRYFLKVQRSGNYMSSHCQRTCNWLRCYGWQVMNRPAYSPDLAPSDFYLLDP